MRTIVDYSLRDGGEIVLRPFGFCNLTEVVVRAEDTVETLLRKVELATILGTFQSTLTDFRYIRKEWKKNAEEERLLGVSLTGIMDNPILNGSRNDHSGHLLEVTLKRLRETTIQTNQEWAGRLGINPSAAITTVN
jgi:ribonucleoside-triphosphate reductase (thioredoxin)